MEQDILLNILLVSVLIIEIFGLSSIIGTRHYRLDNPVLRIKSSRKTLSGQEVLIFCGSVSCVAIPLLFMISAPSITKSLFENLLSNPIAVICFLLMILCPIGVVIVSIYRLISNLAKSLKQNFIKEIVLYEENNYIKVYSNVGNTVIPFDDIISFSLNITKTAAPNVRPGTIRGGIAIGDNFGSGVTGGLIGATVNSGNVDIITDIEIVIHTVNNGVIKINTLGNTIFDSNSQKLLEAIMKYKTKFKNFIINNN